MWPRRAHRTSAGAWASCGAEEHRTPTPTPTRRSAADRDAGGRREDKEAPHLRATAHPSIVIVAAVDCARGALAHVRAHAQRPLLRFLAAAVSASNRHVRVRPIAATSRPASAALVPQQPTPSAVLRSLSTMAAVDATTRLLQQAADGDADAVRRTALTVAGAGVDVNAANRRGWTALHMAARYGASVVGSNANPEAPDTAHANVVSVLPGRVSPPLSPCPATSPGQAAVVEVLLAGGANRALRNADGKTPHDLVHIGSVREGEAWRSDAHAGGRH